MSLLAQQGAMMRSAAPPSAGHSTDFSEYPTGVAPSDWTPRWVTSGVAYTVEEFAGNNVLRAVVSSNGRHAISWDHADEAGNDIEVLAKVRYEDTLNPNETAARIVIRGAGAATTETGYVEQLRNEPDDYEVRKVVSGVFSAIGSGAMSISADSWYWLRMRVEGDSIKAKAWKDGNNEPDTWSIEETDDSLASGWTAFGAQTATTYYCGFFSYNDEGGAAPGPST